MKTSNFTIALNEKLFFSQLFDFLHSTEMAEGQKYDEISSDMGRLAHAFFYAFLPCSFCFVLLQYAYDLNQFLLIACLQ